MDAVFKFIDRLLAAIPANFQRYIRLGALGVWVLLAGLVAFLAYRIGLSSVPQKGEDLYLSNIKEKVYRDRLKRTPVEVTLPDLNELFRKETAPLATYQPEEKPPAKKDESPDKGPLPLQGEKDDILFPQKGVQPEPRGSLEQPERSPGPSRPSHPASAPEGSNPAEKLPPLLPLDGR